MSKVTYAIEIQGISKVYRQGKKQEIQAVAPLDLAIPTGQIFGFLGPNGAGKTTTIKMICGLVKPNSGVIRVNGYDVARQHWQAMRQIGAVLEGTRNVHWRLSAWENLLYFGRLKGGSIKQLKARGEELLRDLGLWDRRHTDIREFSRGMQQQVAIACALIADPPVILLDEPTLGLDIQAARTVKEWTLRLARDYGKTIILTTHQLDVAQALCDHVAIIQKGRLLANQPLEELLSYLGPQDFYRLKIQGELAPHQIDLFPGFKIEMENEDTVITGAIKDNVALQELLSLMTRSKLVVLSINSIEANLEEIFVNLITGTKKGNPDEHHLVSTIQRN